MSDDELDELESEARAEAANAPRLTNEQKTRLRALLNPGRDTDDGDTRAS